LSAYETNDFAALHHGGTPEQNREIDEVMRDLAVQHNKTKAKRATKTPEKPQTPEPMGSGARVCLIVMVGGASVVLRDSWSRPDGGLTASVVAVGPLSSAPGSAVAAAPSPVRLSAEPGDVLRPRELRDSDRFLSRPSGDRDDTSAVKRKLDEDPQASKRVETQESYRLREMELQVQQEELKMRREQAETEREEKRRQQEIDRSERATQQAFMLQMASVMQACLDALVQLRAQTQQQQPQHQQQPR
jgi:hypothetical protein